MAGIAPTHRMDCSQTMGWGEALDNLLEPAARASNNPQPALSVDWLHASLQLGRKSNAPQALKGEDCKK